MRVCVRVCVFVNHKLIIVISVEECHCLKLMYSEVRNLFMGGGGSFHIMLI